MTVADLIRAVEKRLWMQFYNRHETFFRDRQAIQKAISRYGYQCNERGWSPDPEFIYQEISRVIDSAIKAKADIQYLPAYLEQGIDMAVRTRAEEIQAQSRQLDNIAAKIVHGVNGVTAIVEPKPVEVLAHLYKNLNKPRCKKCVEQRQLRLT